MDVEFYGSEGLACAEHCETSLLHRDVGNWMRKHFDLFDMVVLQQQMLSQRALLSVCNPLQ